MSLSNKLLNAVSKPVLSVVHGDEEEEARLRMEKALDDMRGIAMLKEFVQSSLSLPLGMHALLGNIRRAVAGQTEEINSAKKTSQVVDIVAVQLFEHSKPEWVNFASDASSLLELKVMMPELTILVFGSSVNLEDCLTLRVRYAVYTFKELIDMDCFRATFDGIGSLSFMTKLLYAEMVKTAEDRAKSIFMELVAFDLVVENNVKAWAKTWSQLLRCTGAPALREAMSMMSGTFEEAEATHSAMSSTASDPNVGVASQVFRTPASVAAPLTQKTLPMSMIYSFADGPGLMADSKDAQKLKLSKVTLSLLEFVKQGVQTQIWRAYHETSSMSDDLVFDMTQKKESLMLTKVRRTAVGGGNTKQQRLSPRVPRKS